MIRVFRNIGLIIFSVLCMFACDSMTSSYEKYVDDEETVYPGKADSVKAYPGKNRIKLSWISDNDPMVTHGMIYWNSLEDSIKVDLSETQEVDTIEVILDDMKEGSYNFEIRTFDKNENSSIVVNVLGQVYGDRYQSSLLNRSIATVKWQPGAGGDTWIEWDGADDTSLGTILRYTSLSGTSKELVVSPDDSTTRLEDYDAEQRIEYQTMFKPDSAAIDTFYAEESTASVGQIFIKNSGPGIEHGDWDGSRYGNPKEWTVNDAVKNHGGYGGFDGLGGGGYLAMEKWTDSHAEIINGKIYQTMTLPAGTYLFEANFSDASAVNGVKDEAYMVVAKGNSLPDIADISSSAGYSTFDNPEVEFTLTQEQEVTIGFVATLQQNEQNFRCHSVRLYTHD